MSEQRKHHPFSPSTLQAREACPCWSPGGGQNEAASRGTAQHASADSGQDNQSLSDLHAHQVASCLEYCDNLVSGYARRHDGPAPIILREDYFPVDDEPLPDGSAPCTTAGFADFAIVCGEDGDIVDYKFGKHAVEPAANNLQGISYALGLHRRFPQLKRITTHFLMPAINHVTQHTFDFSDPSQLFLRVRCVVMRSYHADKRIKAREPGAFSEASPNTGACMFCARLAECPAVANLILQVGKKYEPLSVPDNIDPLMEKSPKAMGLSLKLAQLATVWGEAYRRTITSRVIEDEEGLLPEGYKLVTSQKSKVLDARKVVEVAKKFLPDDVKGEVEKLYDIPITRVDELISSCAKRGKKEVTVEKFREEAEQSNALKTGIPYAYLQQDNSSTEGAPLV